MPRGVKRPAQQPLPIEVKPDFPQHAKMYATSQQDWAIREFYFFLTTKGLMDWDYEDFNDLILEFRGVDKLEYEAESAQMRSKFRWLYDKFRNGERDSPAKELKPLPAKVVEKLESSDSLAEAALLEVIRRGRQ